MYTIKVNHHIGSQVLLIDDGNIGTEHYIGLAYFWHYEYRHTMRDQSQYRCKLIHDKILKAGFDLSDSNEQIFAIIERYAVKVQ